MIWKVQVSVSVADTVIFVATCEKRIPLFAIALQVVVFQFPKSQNSLCVQVASHAAKKAETYPIAPENVVEDAAFLVTSVQSCVSHAAGAVVLDPSAMYKLSHMSVVLSHAIWAAKAVFATVGIIL